MPAVPAPAAERAGAVDLQVRSARKRYGGFAAVELTAFLKLDLDQFVGGQAGIEGGNDGRGNFATAKHDGRAEIVTETT